MYDKLDFIQEKYEELSLKVSDPDVIADQANWQKYAKELGEMEPIVQKYTEYKKSNKKPSEFCKTELKYKNVKSTEFLKEYFADASVLVSAIIEYKRVSNIRNGECTLADLLR